MKVNIKLKPGCEDIGLPEYKTPGSAACDLMAAINKPITLNPGDYAMIPTAVYMEIPEGYMLHITPRSGLAARNGIGLVNSPGIIDSDYRGEIGVVVINHGDNFFTIKRGDRIAQASFVRVEQAQFEKVEELSETKRGEGGFGHTGVEK